MKFKLPELKFEKSALEPHIDELTMTIHHEKHHATYINNLNAALEGHADLEEWSIDRLLKELDHLPKEIQVPVRNNGGGHYNHTLFWEALTPHAKGPSDTLLKAIEEKFASFDSFKDLFKQAALKRFGSGWAWLVMKDGQLDIISTANQDSPISEGYHELLGLDVWEHAYYLNYQNRRPDYVDAFWHVVDWEVVEERMNQAK